MKYQTAAEWVRDGCTKIGRWWYPVRVNGEGELEVLYPAKDPTWQLASVVREELAERTKHIPPNRRGKTSLSGKAGGL